MAGRAIVFAMIARFSKSCLRAADPKHVIDIFIAKEAQSHIEPDDEAALVDLVSQLGGIGKRPITQRLKQERDRRNREKQASHGSQAPVFDPPCAPRARERCGTDADDEPS